MRVALYEPSGLGGVCQYTHQLAEHLARAGVDVTLITSEGYELESLERRYRVEYLFSRSWWTRLRERIPRRKKAEGRREETPAAQVAPGEPGPPRPSFRRRLRVRLLLLREVVRLRLTRVDCLHVQWRTYPAEEERFIRWLRRAGVPVVYTAHDIEPPGDASERTRVELQRLYDDVSKVVVHTDANRRELLSLFRVDPSKIAVIPVGGYDLFRSPEPLTKDAARDTVGVPRGRKVVLFFGLIKPYKGLEYLVEAFETVRESVPDAFLLIVGDIDASDADHHRRYSELILSLRNREDALCVSRYVPVEAVGAYLAAADVVALPYTRAYQSGVLLSAYAAGRPVVVTDTGGLGEVVEQGQSGVVVPPRDAPALARGIIDVLTDAGRLEKMSRRARELARTVYSWDAVASKTMDLYRSVSRTG